MSRRRVALLAAAAFGVVVIVVGGVAAWTFWPRGTNEVTEEEALDDFRERTVSSTTVATGTDEAPGVPAPGVYTFTAEGSEEVKFGPLPAQTRPLPETITVVVIDRGDGCFEYTVNFFAEHTEDTAWCVGADGELTLDGHTKHQRIGSLSPTANLTCDPAVLIASGARPGESPLACDLALSGTPISIGSTLTGTASLAAPEPLSIGGDEVDARPLTIDYDVTGDLSGSWTETIWLDENHLPLRIERDLSLSGPATFSEESRLDLVDRTPTT